MRINHKSFFSFILTIFVCIVAGCNHNLPENQQLVGRTFKSSNGDVLTLEKKGKAYEFVDSHERNTYKGVYELDQEAKTLVLKPTQVYMNTITVGTKSFFGKYYSRDAYSDFIYGDYIEYLEYFIATDPDHSISYVSELEDLKASKGDAKALEKLKNLVFIDKTFDYWFTEDNKLVIDSQLERGTYAGQYKDENISLSITYGYGFAYLSYYNLNDWFWGDSSLIVKDGTLDKTNKTVNFETMLLDTFEYPCKYEILEENTIKLVFDETSGPLAGSEVFVQGNEENLVSPTDDPNKAIRLSINDFDPGDVLLYTIDQEIKNEDNLIKLYVRGDDGKLDYSAPIVQVNGKFGYDPITMTISGPVFSEPTVIANDCFEYYDDYEPVLFDE